MKSVYLGFAAMDGLTRRQFIASATGFAVASSVLTLPARGLTINPRSTWGSNYQPKGPLPSEDVKFLIVHHSASRNGEVGADGPAALRSWFNYHTGPDKGWNDVAYNFVVDSGGGIWEARQGSLDGPVAGDATGGNQGFTQLVCLIGDFNTAQPSPAALGSLVALLAWLADRYGISTNPGSSVTFESRGSNKWPAGTSVTTPTITGHRSMSKTTCPGSNLNNYVVGGLMADVAAVRAGGTPSGTVAPESTTTTIAAESQETAATTTTTVPTTATTVAPTTVVTTTEADILPTTAQTIPPVPETAGFSAAAEVDPIPTAAGGTTTTAPILASGPPGPPTSSPLMIGAAAIAALATALLLWRMRRMGD